MRALLVPGSAGELFVDRRAALKRQINRELVSVTVEEKSHGLR
jgi:hypothetical protein